MYDNVNNTGIFFCRTLVRYKSCGGPCNDPRLQRFSAGSSGLRPLYREGKSELGHSAYNYYEGASAWLLASLREPRQRGRAHRTGTHSRLSVFPVLIQSACALTRRLTRKRKNWNLSRASQCRVLNPEIAVAFAFCVSLRYHPLCCSLSNDNNNFFLVIKSIKLFE